MTQSAMWDVVIVGCGPIGAFAANLCGQAGLRTLVLEKDDAPYALPRAVHLDHEMVRLFDSIGLRDVILPKMRAGDGHIHVGADHGVIRFMSAADAPKPYGYANDYFFYQPELEADLRAGLSRFEHVELRLNACVEAVSQSEQSATITLNNGEQIWAKWVIGCDGARSTLRKIMQVALDDLEFEEPWLVVDAQVDGPIHYPNFDGVPGGANLQNLSLMMCDPSRPATIVPGRGNHRRWEFMLLPHEQEADISAPETIKDLIAPWVGDNPHEIIRAATYRFHGLVAEQWRQGRLFLAGDAAHQTPPFFGQGMCHGMRDVANLVWKLVLVIADKAQDSLLDTYQTERDGQVRHVIGAAIEAGKYICELDADKAKDRDARIRAQKGMSTAGELIAPLQAPWISKNAGDRFINPSFSEGKFFDDVAGRGWVLLSEQQLALDPCAHDIAQKLNVARVSLDDAGADPAGHLQSYFERKKAQAVLIRPDFYVALTIEQGADPSQSISNWASMLGISPKQPAVA